MARRTGPRAAVATVTLLATVLAAGCATSIGGTAALDPAAASSLASSLAAAHSTATTAESPPTTSSGGASSSAELPTSSGSPIPPVPPSSSALQTTAGSSAAGSSGGSPQTVHGVDIDAVAAALATDPLYADADAKAGADPAELSALQDQVAAARRGGLDIWVVLIGHDVQGLTDVSDAVATKVHGTAVVVTTARFAVSSKQFTQDQLGKAEDAASSASSTVEAASVLVQQFRAMAGAAGRSTGATATGTTTAGTGATGTKSGGDLALTSFQLADHSIGCMIIDGTVRCDLMVDHGYTPPKNPHPDCQGDYGSSIMMAAGKPAAFICISDTVYDPKAAVLPDGADTLVGNVMCFADGSTVTCMNIASAHGFYLSPDAFSVF